MATQKPISSISYNTEPFLREKLEEWKKAHIIQAWQYISHKGEDGDKDHIHFRIEPNKKIDPMDLSEILTEYVQGEEKPRRIRPWRPSKEEDWLLYAVHDGEYLNLKYQGGEKGEKLPYDWRREIQVPDDYDLETAWIRAKASLSHSSVNMATRLRNGENPLNLVLQGENVFTVNALARTLFTNDYSSLQTRYEELKLAYAKLETDIAHLLKAIDEEGFYVSRDDQGRPHLVQTDALINGPW